MKKTTMSPSEYHEYILEYINSIIKVKEDELTIYPSSDLNINKLFESKMTKDNMKKILAYALEKEENVNCRILAFNNFFDYFFLAFLNSLAFKPTEFHYKKELNALYTPGDFEKNDGTIIINLNKIKGDKDTKIINLLLTLYHELEHIVQTKDSITILRENSYYSFDTLYNFILEDIILNNKEEIYYKLYHQLSTEKYADLKGIEKIYDFLFKNKPDKNVLLNIKTNRLLSDIDYEEDFVRYSTFQDMFIKECPQYLDIYMILNLEYEKTGDRKKLSTLIGNHSLKNEDSVLYASTIRRTIYNMNVDDFIEEKNKLEDEDKVYLNKFIDIELNSLKRVIKLEDYLDNKRNKHRFEENALHLLEIKENLNAIKKVKN